MSALPAPGFLAIGLMAGALHFALLRRNAALYLRPHGFWTAIALQGLRLVLLGAVLALLARQGAGPLLLGALGVVLARQVVLRRLTGAPP